MLLPLPPSTDRDAILHHYGIADEVEQYNDSTRQALWSGIDHYLQQATMENSTIIQHVIILGRAEIEQKKVSEQGETVAL